MTGPFLRRKKSLNKSSVRIPAFFLVFQSVGEGGFKTFCGVLFFAYKNQNNVLLVISNKRSADSMFCGFADRKYQELTCFVFFERIPVCRYFSVIWNSL